MDATGISRPISYDVLLGTRNLAADEALVAALPEMEPAYQQSALALLIARDHESTLAEVVAGFDASEDMLRRLLVHHANALTSGIRRCMANERFEARRSALSLIHASGSGHLAYLLSDALTYPCRKTAELAAHILRSLVEENIPAFKRFASSRQPAPRGEWDYLVGAVGRGLSSWPVHYRGDVVTAAARLSEALEETIVTLVDDPRTKLSRAFATAIDKPADPVFAPFHLRALRCASLRPQALKIMSGARDPRWWRAMLDASWVLVDPTIRRAFVRVRTFNPEGLALARTQFAGSGGGQGQEQDQERGQGRGREHGRGQGRGQGRGREHGRGRGRAVVRIVVRSGLPATDKASFLRELVDGSDLAAARAAYWAVIENRFEGSDGILESIAGRAASPLASLARIELLRRKRGSSASTGEDNYENYTPSHLPRARASSAFDVYWAEFETLSPKARVEVGTAVIRGTSDFSGCLKAKLGAENGTDRGRALRMIASLDLGKAMAEEVCHAARDPESTVRSQAVILLGEIRSGTSRRLLRAALDDCDARVQANAIEALERHGDKHASPQILAKLEASDNRVRANAVKMLLGMRVRDAAQHLALMLDNESPAHRLSALWVVERFGLANVMGRLEKLAADDTDSRVRRRARRVLRSAEAKTNHAVPAKGVSAKGVPAKEASS